jgi:dihydroflavonol-4-reductase
VSVTSATGDMGGSLWLRGLAGSLTVGKTLVTGATGLVGSHVARALVARGDDVRVTVREHAMLDAIAGLDVEVVTADVLQRRDMRRALRGVDRLFHVAGATTLRAGWRDLYDANVTGTRIALEEALRAGVERAVHTSAVAALGPAQRGSTADETHVLNAARVGIAYANIKAEAEREALRVCAQGLPLVIVNPAHVLGPGDLYRSSTELVRRFLRREIPAYVDGALCIVGAADVARGHLLAEEKGRVGERYILGGRNFTNDRLFADLGRLSGVEPPALKLPLPAALAWAQAAQALPGRPALTVEEVRALSLWWAFRSTKAKRELGWTPGHHEQPLVDTIEWFRSREPTHVGRPGERQPLPLRVAGFGLRRAESALRLLAAD